MTSSKFRICSSTKGYEAAAPYLRKMHDLYEKNGRSSEWKTFLSALREANKRRPRMLQVLDSVEGVRRKIIG